ncbi:palmitoyltransferase ZDHHC13 isoform X3 [Pelodiscus sinensis]|uniref:Palmitoyltransferase n=3 Tax=Pelodiscus sinensis TaxID=13735 RepID=K7FDZ4_PELSI|nr:palmitoyltransferase ZDHHC13 isoform X1 [Pelodiscus sinensis]|eukprot:XP_006111543.1 palmitoyltransferase ZDHHC13 isoform X1 [Pelodiscus sinensis]
MRLPECKNHSHGPHGPHAQNWHCVHKDKDQMKMQATFPLPEDYSNCDIVKATQYGILDRCKELVEAGYDVRQPDKENVTLLHWAAINNRLDLVKFYISKGAVVDQLGGDLNSTPLHWAIREGHLAMVILLLKCGADPTLIDGEGYSGIHLAVVFQHMPIIAYLISKGQSIDTTDFSGQTPLMLSAQKVIGPEPTGFLLKFNPSLNTVDKIQKNTALHWAVTAGNVSAVELLLDAGSNLDIKNIKGDTPLDLAHHVQNRLIIHMLTEEEKMRIRKNSRLFMMLAKYEFFLLLMSSLTLIWAIGYIADLNSDSWLLKGSMLLFIFFGMALLTRHFVGLKSLKYLPAVFMLSSIFWMSMTWFVWFLPDLADTIFQIPFILSVVGLLYYFYKTWRTDPGCIKISEEERRKSIVTLAEAGCLDLRTFCISCLVKKPLRSMHCIACNSCIARYDQHCLWTGQCIGVGNHYYFLLFLLFLTMMGTWMFYGTLLYWSEHCATTYHQDGAWTYLTQIVSCSPWVLYIFTIVCFHTLWTSLMLIIQLYQIAFLGLTSHERITLTLQSRCSKQAISLRKTPYNHGCFQNLADFFQCRCFGMFTPNVVDWTKQYTLFHPARGKNVHSV